MQASILEKANLADTKIINMRQDTRDDLASPFALVKCSKVTLPGTAGWLIRLRDNIDKNEGR
jgi:hypothetical protein